VNLKEIRETFREETGRYDLVTSAGSNAGVDKYINSAQKWLDRQLDFEGADAQVTKSLSTASWSTELEGLRAVKSVAVEDPNGDFCYLDRRQFMDVQELLKNSDSSSYGLPRYWSEGRLLPGNRTSGVFKLFTYPAADSAYTLYIEGLFGSTELVSDTDQSFWSALFPMVLVKATFMKAEAFQRNSTGERDLRQSVLDELRGIDHDEVERQLAESDQLKSVWRDILV